VYLFACTFSADCELQSEREHTRVKRFYELTNRKKNFVSQIASQQRRSERAQGMQTALLSKTASLGQPARQDWDDEDKAASNDIREHHHIARSTNNPVDIVRFVRETMGDPATKVLTISPSMELLAHSHYTGYHSQAEG
jgi:hypothetical protein